MNIFSSASPSSKSWFWKLRNLCLQYDLPHPVAWLSTKPTKLQVKTMARLAVLQFWLEKLRTKANTLSSLQYLKTGFLGLTKPHPLFRTCSSSPREVEKATSQARLLSGRSRVEALTGHWIPWNKDRMCTLPECWETENSHEGTVEAFLMTCPSLSGTRDAMDTYCRSYITNSYPVLLPLVQKCLESDPVQFMLDCSTMAPVISAVQADGENVLFPLFKITRNYCHGLYTARVNLLSQE